jgi:hypothetical protein
MYAIEIVKDTTDAVEARWQDMHQEAADEAPADAGAHHISTITEAFSQNI